MVGDRLPVNAPEDDTNAFFTNEEIADILDQATNDLNLAAAIGWAAKMAEFVKFVDRDDAGSTRKLSQLAKNADLMLAHYSKLSGHTTAEVKGRAAGGVISLRESRLSRSPAAGFATATHRFLGSEPQRQIMVNSHPDQDLEGYPAPMPEPT